MSTPLVHDAEQKMHRKMSPEPKLNMRAADELIERALAEDIGPGDVTTAALVGAKSKSRGRLVARANGVLAGMPVARRLLRKAGGIRLSGALRDGARLKSGTVIATVSGSTARLLAVERTLLNFLQHLSGIATLTRRYVDAVAGTGARVLDTRKTLPGWRGLAKYAVAVGGGQNHRMGLYDQVLIKDNHLRAAGISPAEAVGRFLSTAAVGADRTCPHSSVRVEVEVETVADARAAALAGADIVMLDNMPPTRMAKAVAAIRSARPQTIIEVSGGVTLASIRHIALTGVDWISVGALTHSAPALDISLELEAN